MQLTSLANWLLFSFFVVGSLGGITYFVRLMFWKEAGTEVRYVQIPVYYGYERREPVNDGVRPGDMAQHEAEAQPAQ